MQKVFRWSPTTHRRSGIRSYFRTQWWTGLWAALSHLLEGPEALTECYQAWCANSSIIATGSSDSAIEGRHYYRSMRIHKGMFCALVRYRVERLSNNYESLDDNLKDLFRVLFLTKIIWKQFWGKRSLMIFMKASC